MKKKDLRIVFMGTPEFAVESLKSLVEGGYNVAAVITMPDKPIGRHQDKLSCSPVKEYAIQRDIPVLQPKNLKDEVFVSQLKQLDADLQIVVAFRMLPEVVWGMPRLGTFNLHASLLPQYRGAAPINWAIINGEKETGITTFFLQHAIDTGDIIQRKSIPILPSDNAGSIHDKLKVMGAQLVVETVNNILNDNVKPLSQSEFTQYQILHAAPKIFKDTCKINWNWGVERCFNFVRGLSPYPAAWTEICSSNGKASKVLKIYAAEKEFAQPVEKEGTILIEGKKTMKIALKDGYLSLKVVQLAGKKKMKIEDFLPGYRLDEKDYVR